VNNELVEVEAYIYGETIIDVAIDTSTDSEQNIFITASTNGRYYEWNESSYEIRKLTAKGHLIWASPGLIGKPLIHGLKIRHSARKGYEMMLSTDSMMYLID
jgi:hypothetical protein